jgi:hypothetical protein
VTISEEVAALQDLHGRQGYLIIGSVDPLPPGPIDLKVRSTDHAYYQARWSIVGESDRVAFEEQAHLVFGRDSGLWRMQYFYRVCALD